MFNQFKNLQKQAIELFKNFENRLSESNAFNILKEKYQSLNIRRQKLIKYFLILFIFGAIVYFPLSYLFSSVSSWSDFKQKYSLSLDLLQARSKKKSALFLSEEDLRMKIRRIAEKYTDSDFEMTDKIKPFPQGKSTRQLSFRIRFKYLNVRQAVRLGTELNALPQIRLNEIILEENKEYPKHYDSTYQLLAFVSKKKPRPSVIKRRPIERKKGNQNDSIKNTTINKEDKADQKIRKRKARPRKTLED